MAKINNGPIVAGVSGSIGELTFLQTRFGQIVQGKSSPPIFTTAPAMLTKGRFRSAMSAYMKIQDPIRSTLKAIAYSRLERIQQATVSAFYKLQQSGLWLHPYYRQDQAFLRDTGSYRSGSLIHVVTNLSADPFQYWGYAVTFSIDAGIGTVHSWIPLLLTLPSSIVYWPVAWPPVYLVIFPVDKTRPGTLAKSGIIPPL